MGGTSGSGMDINGKTSTSATSSIGGVNYAPVTIGATTSNKNTVWWIIGGAAVLITAILAFTLKRP